MSLLIIYFFKAWMIGIVVAAPVGPIGMLCIRKTLEMGRVGALSVGLGAALADSFYGLIAALGLTAISHILLEQSMYIKLLGGLFLLYLAYNEINSKSTQDQDLTIDKNRNLWRLIAVVFFLTLANPMTIFIFVGIFAGIGGGAETFHETLVMVLGVFLGSMTWWCILGTIITRIKHKLPEYWIERIRSISALMLAGFGVLAIIGAFI